MIAQRLSIRDAPFQNASLQPFLFIQIGSHTPDLSLA